MYVELCVPVLHKLKWRLLQFILTCLLIFSIKKNFYNNTTWIYAVIGDIMLL